jgi:antitoxin component of RelBE/YafQ-DinJ toxin-antitoxin module
MTQIRPRLDDDLAAEVQAYVDRLGISFNAAVKVLLHRSLGTIKGDGNHENDT